MKASKIKRAAAVFLIWVMLLNLLPGNIMAALAETVTIEPPCIGVGNTVHSDASVKNHYQLTFYITQENNETHEMEYVPINPAVAGDEYPELYLNGTKYETTNSEDDKVYLGTNGIFQISDDNSVNFLDSDDFISFVNTRNVTMITIELLDDETKPEYELYSINGDDTLAAEKTFTYILPRTKTVIDYETDSEGNILEDSDGNQIVSGTHEEPIPFAPNDPDNPFNPNASEHTTDFDLVQADYTLTVMTDFVVSVTWHDRGVDRPEPSFTITRSPDDDDSFTAPAAERTSVNGNHDTFSYHVPKYDEDGAPYTYYSSVNQPAAGSSYIAEQVLDENDDPVPNSYSFANLRDFKCTLEWHTGNTTYTPSQADVMKYITDNFKLKQQSNVAGGTDEEIDMSELTVEYDAATGELTIKGLRDIDSNGRAIAYYLEPDYDDVSEQTFDRDDTDDEWMMTAENLGVYSSETKKVFPGGTISNVQFGSIDINGTVEWRDAANETNRLSNVTHDNSQLILWRYSNDLSDPNASEMTAQAAILPLTHEKTGEAGTYEYYGPYVFENVPKYDVEGYPYVYYVKERFGSGYGDYVIEYQDENGGQPTTAGAPDEGTIVNTLEGTVAYTIQADWVAAARQGGTANLKYQIQQYVNGVWTAVTLHNLPAPTHADPNATTDSDVVEIKNFTSEQMSQSITLPALQKYDPDGSLIQYRIVQVEVDRTDTIKGQTVHGKYTGTNINSIDTTSPTNIQLVNTGTNENADKYEVTVTTTGTTVKFNYKLVGETEITIRKIWNNNGISTDHSSQSITYELKRMNYYTGKYESYTDTNGPNDASTNTGTITHADLIETTNDGEIWQIKVAPDAYDDEGHTYQYQIRETATSGTGSDEHYYTTYAYDKAENCYKIINKRTTEGGRGIWLEKQWADDGEEEFRHPVTINVSSNVYTDGNGVPHTQQSTLSEDKLWENEISTTADGSYVYAPDDFTESSAGSRYTLASNISNLPSGVTIPEGAKWVYAVSTENYANSPGVDLLAAAASELEANNSSAYFANADYFNKNVYAQDGTTVTANKRFVGIYKTANHYYAVEQQVAAGNNNPPSRITFINTRIGVVNYKINFEWKTADWRTQNSDKNVVVRLSYTNSSNTQVYYDVTIPMSQAIGDYYIKNLPKYDENGKVIDYKLSEISIAGVSLQNGSFNVGNDKIRFSIQQQQTVLGTDAHNDDLYSYKITNTFSDVTSITINKLWRDDSRPEDQRPNIYLRRSYRSANPNSSEWVVEQGDYLWERDSDDTHNHWTYTFSGLPKYDSDGYEYTYRVEELKIPGYRKEYWTKDSQDNTVRRDTGANEADHYAYNGDQIRNIREGETSIDGEKLWSNINQVFSEAHYPIAEVYLYRKESGVTYVDSDTEVDIDSDGTNETIPYSKAGKGQVIAATEIFNGAKEFAFPDTFPYIRNSDDKKYKIERYDETAQQWVPSLDAEGSMKLPKYDEMGRVIEYSLGEKAINGYAFKITDQKIVNNYNGGEEVQIRVKKRWYNMDLGAVFPDIKLTLHQVARVKTFNPQNPTEYLMSNGNYVYSYVEYDKFDATISKSSLTYNTGENNVPCYEATYTFGLNRAKEDIRRYAPDGEEFLYFITENFTNYKGETEHFNSVAAAENAQYVKSGTSELILGNTNESGHGFICKISPVVSVENPDQNSSVIMKSATVENHYEPDDYNFKGKLIVNKSWNFRKTQNTQNNEFEADAVKEEVKGYKFTVSRHTTKISSKDIMVVDTEFKYNSSNTLAPQATGGHLPAVTINAPSTVFEFAIDKPMKAYDSSNAEVTGDLSDSAVVDGVAYYQVSYTFKKTAYSINSLPLTVTIYPDKHVVIDGVAIFGQDAVLYTYTVTEDETHTFKKVAPISRTMAEATETVEQNGQSVEVTVHKADFPLNNELNVFDLRVKKQFGKYYTDNNNQEQRELIPAEEYEQYFDDTNNTYINSLTFTLERSGDGGTTYTTYKTFPANTLQKVNGEYYFEIPDIPIYTADGSKKFLYRLIEDNPGTHVKAYWQNGNQETEQSTSLVTITPPNSEVQVTSTVTNYFASKRILVSKLWDDSDNCDGLRPTQLDITLTETVPNVAGTISINKTLSDSDTDKWKMYVDLPKYYYNGSAPKTGLRYNISEDLQTYNDNIYEKTPYQAGYICDEVGYYYTGASISSPTGKLIENGQAAANADANGVLVMETSGNTELEGLYLKNKKDRYLGTITVSKKWKNDDDLIWQVRPNAVYVLLQRRLEPAEGETGGTWETAAYYDGTPVSVQALSSGGTSVQIEGLPLGITSDSPSAQANGTFTRYEYRVVECDSNGNPYSNTNQASFNYKWNSFIGGSSTEVQTAASANDTTFETRSSVLSLVETNNVVTGAALTSVVKNEFVPIEHTMHKTWIDGDDELYSRGSRYGYHLQRYTEGVDNTDPTNITWHDLAQVDSTNQNDFPSKYTEEQYKGLGGSSSSFSTYNASNGTYDTKQNEMKVDADTQGKTSTTHSNTQTHVFSGLPKYDAYGRLYHYRVIEDYIRDDTFWVEEHTTTENNVTTVTYGTSNYSVKDGRVAGQISSNGTVTNIENTTKPLPDYTHIYATKTWDDNENQDSVRPAEVWFRLTQTYTDPDPDTHQIVTTYSCKRATKETDWKVEWTNCPGFAPVPTANGNVTIMYSYTVDEVVRNPNSHEWDGQGSQSDYFRDNFSVVEYNTASTGGGSGTQDVHSTGTAHVGEYTTSCNNIISIQTENGIPVRIEPFTNSYTPKLNDLTVSKVWDENDNHSLRPDNIKFVLYCKYPLYQENAQHEIVQVLDNNNQPAYYDGPVSDKTAQKAVSNNKCILDNAQGVTLNVNGCEQTIPKAAAQQQCTWTDLPVYFNYLGTSTDAGIVPEVKVTYYVKEVMIGSSGSGDLNDTYDTNKKIDYICPTDSKSTDTDLTGNVAKSLAVTNTLDTRTVTVTKAWNDQGYQNAPHYKIHVTLKNSGYDANDASTQIYYAETDIDTDQTSADFANVPKYKDGVPISYVVDEVVADDHSKLNRYGYERQTDIDSTATDARVSKTILTQRTITNKLPLTSVTVNENWVDEGYAELLRPDSVAVGLHRTSAATTNGQSENVPDWSNEDTAFAELATSTHNITGQKTTDLWTYTFDKLLMYDADNNPYCYKAVEEITSIPQYKHSSKTAETDANFTDAAANVKPEAVGTFLTGDPAAPPTSHTLEFKNELIKNKIKLQKQWDDAGSPEHKRYNINVTMTSPTLSGKSYTVTIPACAANASTSSEVETTTTLPVYDTSGVPIKYTLAEKTAEDSTKDYFYHYSLTSIKQNNTSVNNGNITVDDTGVLTYVIEDKTEKTDLTLTKQWDDFANKFSLRPGTNEVTFSLYRTTANIDATSNTQYLSTSDADEATKWVKVETAKYTPVGPTDHTVAGSSNDGTVAKNYWTVGFNNLLKYGKNNTEYKFMIVEEYANGVKAYGQLAPVKATASGSGQTAAMTNTLLTRNVTVTKTWAGDSNYAQSTRYNVDVTLYSDDVSCDESGRYVDSSTKHYYETKTVNTLTQQSTTLTYSALPEFDKNGNVINYFVKENANGLAETASPTHETGNYFKQYATKYGYVGSCTKVDASTGGYVSSYAITNTLPTTAQPIQKTWTDDNNQNGLRPTSVKFKLYRTTNTTVKNDATAAITNDEATGWVYVSEHDVTSNWQYTFANLLQYNESGLPYYYMVEEVYNQNTMGAYYELTGADAKKTTGTAQQTSLNTLAFANTLITTTVTVTKNWNDNGYGNVTDAMHYPLSIKLAPQSGGGTHSFTQTLTTPSNSTTGSQTFTVPVYNASHQNITYDITETAQDGNYSLSGSSAKVKYRYTPDSSSYSVTVQENPGANDNRCTITNSLPLKRVSVTKNWDDLHNKYNLRPSDVTFELYRTKAAGSGLNVGNNEATGWVKISTTQNDNKLYTKSTVTKTTNSGNTLDTWTFNYDKLLRYAEDNTTYRYMVREVYDGNTLGAYEVLDTETTYVKQSVDKATTGDSDNYALSFTNRMPRTNVTVVKEWNDQNHTDLYTSEHAHYDVRIRIDKVDIAAYSSTAQTIAADSSATLTFTNLPLYTSAGANAKYTLKELLENENGSRMYGYTQTYSTTSGTSLTNGEFAPAVVAQRALKVTNTLPLTTVDVTKTWSDYSDKYKLRPASIELKLYRTTAASPGDVTGSETLQSNAASGWQLVNTVTVTGSTSTNTWTRLFGDLLRYDASNNEYKYKIVETCPSNLTGYTTTYSPDYTATGEAKALGVTNTLKVQDVTVNKVWDDSSYAAYNDSTYYNQLHYDVNVKLEADSTQAGVPSGFPTIDRSPDDNQLYKITKANSTNGGSVVIKNVPVYGTNGNQIHYIPNERPTDIDNYNAGSTHYGYVKSYYLASAPNTRITDFTLTEGADGAITVKNTLPLTTVTVQKNWNYTNAYPQYSPGDITATLKYSSETNTTAAVVRSTGTYTTQNVALTYDSTSGKNTKSFANELVYDRSNKPYTYSVEEQSLIRGFVLDTSNSTLSASTVSNNAEVNPVSLYLTNKEIQHSVELTKIDGTYERLYSSDFNNYRDKTLSGAKFKLYKTKTGESDQPCTASLSNGVYTFTGIAANDNSATEIVSGANGQISINGLPLGTYKLVETEAPNGYELNSTPYTFELNVNESNVSTDSFMNPEKKIRNEEQKATAALTKKDAVSNTTITETKATYYLLRLIPRDVNATDLQAGSEAAYLSNAKAAITGFLFDADHVEASMANLNKYWQIAKTEQTDNGTLTVPMIEHGTYFFMEYQAPVGYLVDNSTSRFSVNNVINTDVFTVTAANHNESFSVVHSDPRKKATVDVYKQDEFGNPLNGSQFELYYDPPKTDGAPLSDYDYIFFTDNGYFDADGDNIDPSLNESPWETVYAYFFDEYHQSVGEAFPGTVQNTYWKNDDQNRVYKVKIPDGAKWVVFSNGTGQQDKRQTVDINFRPGYGYYKTGAYDNNNNNIIYYVNDSNYESNPNDNPWYHAQVAGSSLTSTVPYETYGDPIYIKINGYVGNDKAWDDLHIVFSNADGVVGQAAPGYSMPETVTSIDSVDYYELYVPAGATKFSVNNGNKTTPMTIENIAITPYAGYEIVDNSGYSMQISQTGLSAPDPAPTGLTAPIKIAHVTTGDDGLTASVVIDDANYAEVSGNKVVLTNWGTYYWKETGAPQGYTVDREVLETFTVNAEKADMTVYIAKASDSRKKGSIALSKVAGERVGTYKTGDALTGATFALYKKGESSPIGLIENSQGRYSVSDTGTLVTTLYTVDDGTNDGKLYIDNLDWGEYELKEITAPAGFRASAAPVSFSVGRNNCNYVQQLTCRNMGQKASLTITKNLNEYRTNWGAPTFLFKVRQTDGSQSEHTVTIQFTSAEATTMTKTSEPVQLEPGTYEVTEINVSRYATTSISGTVNGSAIPNANIDLTNSKIEFTVTGDNAVVSLNFTNKIAYYDKFSHTSIESNNFNGVKGIKASDITTDLTGGMLNTDGHYYKPISKSDLAAALLMSDGTTSPIGTDDLSDLVISYTGKTYDDSRFGVLANDNSDTFSVMCDPIITSGYVYTLTASYTYAGQTFTTDFNITFAERDDKLKKEVKVIFKNDENNASYFIDGSKNTALYEFTYVLEEVSASNYQIKEIKHNGVIISDNADYNVMNDVNGGLKLVNALIPPNTFNNKWKNESDVVSVLTAANVKGDVLANTTGTITYTAVLDTTNT